MQTLDEKNIRHHMRAKLQELLPIVLNQEYIKEHHSIQYQLAIDRNKSLAKRLDIDLTVLRKN